MKLNKEIGRTTVRINLNMKEKSKAKENTASQLP